jgi:hypothetical protein
MKNEIQFNHENCEFLLSELERFCSHSKKWKLLDFIDGCREFFDSTNSLSSSQISSLEKIYYDNNVSSYLNEIYGNEPWEE